ncbi:MAG TPA: MFS transporter [Bryobacteraceae bacterium]|nr:MFS transporter [Bryobacteraceae bacterium]
MPSPSVKTPPAWLVGMSQLSFGLVAGFSITALPFLLTRAGVSVDRVASVSAAAMSPTFWGFLATPLVDAGWSRRTWSFLLLGISAVSLSAALWTLSAAHLVLLTAFLIVAELSIVLFGAACGGWTADFVPDSLRGRVGGWTNAANLGGGAFGSMVVMELAAKFSLRLSSGVLLALCLLPALLLLAFPAPSVPQVRLRSLLLGTLRNVWRTSRKRASIVGYILFLSPAGCVAAINLFSGLGNDFHASSQQVIWITGAGCAIVSSLGSLVGGWIADRWNRGYLYLTGGILAGACALAMAFAPHSATTFDFGVLTYNAVAGLSYAAFTALQLQLVGPGNPVASTQMALFSGSVNGAIVYMTWLDGQGYRLFGARGLLCVDAAAALCAAIPLLFLVRFESRRARRTDPVLELAE